MAIQNFPDPYITACFISDDLIFVNIFYNPALTHYHFLWDLNKESLKGNFVKLVMDTTTKNFPYKCFYNNEEK